jgi:hypothetical protein
VTEELGIGEFSAVSGDIGLFHRQFAVRVDLFPVHPVQLVVQVVEEELLSCSCLAEDEDGRQSDGGLLVHVFAPERYAVDQRDGNGVDEIDDFLSLAAVADYIAQPVRGYLRVFVGDIAG